MWLWQKVIKRLLIYSVVAIATLAALLLYRSYDFFYYPSSDNYGTSPENNHYSYEDIYFNSQDGTQLHGWFVSAHAPEVKGTVIYVHGNAENITSQWFFVEWLPARGFNVFLFDYRGYGKSKGKPEPQGLMEDTQSAINYVSSRTDIDPDKMVIFAQSLGGNNAIAAIGNALERLPEAEKQPSAERADKQFLSNVVNIKALFIDSTFYSYPSIAHDHFWGAGLFFSDRYSAERYIERLSPMPLFFIHNKGDSVIPYQHSQRLFDKAAQPKELILIEGGDHTWGIVAYGTTYKDIMAQFFEKALSEQNE